MSLIMLDNLDNKLYHLPLTHNRQNNKYVTVNYKSICHLDFYQLMNHVTTKHLEEKTN